MRFTSLWYVVAVIMTEVTCSECKAGFCRVELWSSGGSKGEFHCPVCDQVLEVFNGTRLIAYRLTVRPEITFSSSPEVSR